MLNMQSQLLLVELHSAEQRRLSELYLSSGAFHDLQVNMHPRLLSYRVILRGKVDILIRIYPAKLHMISD